MSTIVCPQCKAVVSGDDWYCRKCGTQLKPLPLEKTTAKSTSLGLRCPDCGAGIHEEDDFCPRCGTNLSEPVEPQGLTNETEPGQFKRGFWLTALLILWMISNIGFAFYYLYGLIANAVAGNSSTLPLLGWMLFRACANIVSLIALWKWKKWGVYAMVILLIIGDIITLPSLTNISSIIGTLVGSVAIVVILYFLLRRLWKQMS